jgi:D-alanine-D-alanine ligase
LALIIKGTRSYGKKNHRLIFGGISSEREVSLNSGKQVYDALDKQKYDILTYDPKTDIPKLVADAGKIDCALIILHGPYGEDGTVQGFLDLLDIPYQGAGVLGSAVAMNKLLVQASLRTFRVERTAYDVVRRGDAWRWTASSRETGTAVVVKPVETGSSVGMSIVRDASSLAGAVENALIYGATAMIEAYISGTEITCGVLGNEDGRGAAADRDHSRGKVEFFDYEAKYQPGATQEICPARSTAS